MKVATGKKAGFDCRPVESAREDFPILKTEMNGHPLVFLDSAASSQKPQAVIEAINTYYTTQNANVHRGVYTLSQQATDLFEESRLAVARFINAPSEKEVIFVRGATEGINLVAQSYGRAFLNAGDEIVLSELEHHSNIVPWQILAEEKNLSLKIIPVREDGSLDMDAYKKLLSSKTALVTVNHISNALGTINPVEEITKLAKECGAAVLIDGAQASIHGSIDVASLGADFYVFSGHKMLGPTGIGVLWGREDILEAMPPWQGGGEMIQSVSFEKTTYNELPFKFEAGTPHIEGVVGLKKAIDYLSQFDPADIIHWERKLLNHCTAKLTAIPGLRIIGTTQNKTSVVSFLVEGTHPYDLGIILDKLGIAVRTGHHCTQPLMEKYGIPGTVRASMALYNNKEDIDRLAEGVEKARNMLV
ncbi:MAG: cysteine desulfurase [Saprospirales bacterium]|nr:MAG: cysteine desulfurase [Saprospirales bacterium]